MRITEVTRQDASWSPLALHPRLTVVSGDPVERAEVVAVLAAVYAEAGSGTGGTLEFSGLRMPLDQTAVVSLDLHGSGLRTLGPDEVRAALQTVRSEVRGAAEGRVREIDLEESRLVQRASELGRRRAASEAALGACGEEVDRARELVDELGEKLAMAHSRPRELAEQLASGVEARDVLGSRVAEATRRIDQLCSDLSAGSAAIGSLRLGGSGGGQAAVRDALEQAAQLGLLEEASTRPVLDWLDAVASGTAPAAESVSEMMDEVRAVDAAWAELTARGVEGDPAVAEARGAHEQLQQRHEALSGLADSGVLAERARQEIDAAHESGDPDAEAEVLAAYGFGSHLDFTIAVSTRSVGDAVQSTLERAHAEMVRAADALESERERAAAERTEMGARRDALRDRIEAVTGVAAESLDADDVAAIPEPCDELLSLPATMRASLEDMAAELRILEEQVREVEAQQEALADPGRIEAELAEHQARVAALEPLMEQADRDRELTASQEAEVAATLEALRSERAELNHRADSIDGTGHAVGSPELAMLARGVLDLLDNGSGEPEPVLLEDSLAFLGDDAPDVLDAILEDDRNLQVVYVADQAAVSSWARRRGDAVALVRLGRRGWFGRGRRLAIPSLRGRSSAEGVTPRS